MVHAFLHAKLKFLFSFLVRVDFLKIVCVHLVYDFHNKYNRTVRSDDGSGLLIETHGVQLE